MALNTKGEYKGQAKGIIIRCSEEFRRDVKRAAGKAQAPSVSEWVKATLIKEGAVLGVKIRR